MGRRFILINLFVAAGYCILIAGCGEEPAGLYFSSETNEDSDDESSGDPEGKKESVENDTGPASQTEPGEDTGSDRDTGSPLENDDPEPIEKSACPQTNCIEMGQPPEDTCKNQFPDWVHYLNYDCQQPDAICCGPRDYSQGDCNLQSDMFCQASCQGDLVQNSDYFCPRDDMTCCMDLRGTCVEADGVCQARPLFGEPTCPQATTKSNLICPNNGQCCLPPKCPWVCEPPLADRPGSTCTASLTQPDSVANHNYSCENEAFCCQPLDAPKGNSDKCNAGQNASCKNGCANYEVLLKDRYCDNAMMICCEDSREKCVDELGGVCLSGGLFGGSANCPEGQEDNYKGKCPDNGARCCTTVKGDNACVGGGGTCINPKNACNGLGLLWMQLPSSCGRGDDRICCRSLL